MNALRTAQRVAGRAAVCAFVFAAACGGDRAEGGSTAAAAGADTTAAATSPTDTVAAVTPDTGSPVPGARDSTTALPAPGSSVSRMSGADTAGSRAGDTAAVPKPAPRPTTAAKPKPRPAAPAAAPAQDTASGQAAAPSPDTPSTQAAAPAGQQDTGTGGAQPSQETGTQTANAPLRDPYHQAPRDTVSQEVYDGWKQYNLNCARCHGEDVLGTTIAPHLIMSLKPDGPINTKELFVQTVCAGRPERGMPAWCPLGMEMDKINAIYSYVHGRSEGKLGPGRPALRQGG